MASDARKSDGQWQAGCDARTVSDVEAGRVGAPGGKALQVLQSLSLRGIVEQANGKGIQKDDIVRIMRGDGVYFLLYYK